jgi:nicotinate-nucleotide adenylyltransferase
MSFLGVLGGMFDPVHNGHIEAARCALGKLALDEVRMVPCRIPNHREPAQFASAHRLNMIELASADEPRIQVDPIEINRIGTSYMVDTLSMLKTRHIDSALVLILGVDSFNTMPQWHSWSQFPELCHFLILGRPGNIVSEEVIHLLSSGRGLVDTASELFATACGNIKFVKDFDFDISSSKVREGLATNADLSDVLDEKVIDYIRMNNLYVK